MYTFAAQYNSQYPTLVCNGIDGAPKGTNIIDRIFAGVAAFVGANRSCYDTNQDVIDGWTWQVCSELVIPIGRDMNDSMFQPKPFDLSKFNELCKKIFGVTPRPHWDTTYYGGQDIKRVLHNFASNIIFSNGFRTVLEDISDTVVAVTTLNGSHCLDILSPDESDPFWLIKQRQKEVEIIQGWIEKYYNEISSST